MSKLKACEIINLTTEELFFNPKQSGTHIVLDKHTPTGKLVRMLLEMESGIVPQFYHWDSSKPDANPESITTGELNFLQRFVLSANDSATRLIDTMDAMGISIPLGITNTHTGSLGEFRYQDLAILIGGVFVPVDTGNLWNVAHVGNFDIPDANNVECFDSFNIFMEYVENNPDSVDMITDIVVDAKFTNDDYQELRRRYPRTDLVSVQMYINGIMWTHPLHINEDTDDNADDGYPFI